jgi:hypothetical protein
MPAVGRKPVDQAFVAVVLQRLQRQRAEQFLGCRKARQQALEVARAFKAAVQAARQLALGGAGRADQQHMLARQARPAAPGARRPLSTFEQSAGFQASATAMCRA